MRLRSALLGLLFAVASGCFPAPRAARDARASDPPPSAAATCPADTVVWVSTRSGVYHMPGMTWFDHAREGTYRCRREADRARFRDTRNGQ